MIAPETATIARDRAAVRQTLTIKIARALDKKTTPGRPNALAATVQ